MRAERGEDGLLAVAERPPAALAAFDAGSLDQAVPRHRVCLDLGRAVTRQLAPDVAGDRARSHVGGGYYERADESVIESGGSRRTRLSAVFGCKAILDGEVVVGVGVGDDDHSRALGDRFSAAGAGFEAGGEGDPGRFLGDAQAFGRPAFAGHHSVHFAGRIHGERVSR